ncbi:helix-turn-helix domain-containing protein [Micromonospora zhanjiangensis]|uniref:Helix-turn-helix domain-containing protein n=1 Tax=Micromonospora zhanjiangensis TaxID=1522057 RepID=A0ABV8KN02_9ACTN
MLRRQIGRKFEALRKAAGITMEDAAERLDRARATLYRIENGAETVRFRQADVEQMLNLYGASAEEAELLLAMTAATRENKNWWHDYIGSGLPRWFNLYVGLEASAATIRRYQNELVPGLLQTRAYAEQVFSMPGGAVNIAEPNDVQRAIQLRMERQAILTRFSPLQLSVILNESVLRRQVGSPEIMSEQLNQIIKAAELPNVTVKILPFSAGLHAGAMTGAFSILEFPRGKDGEVVEPTVVYIETATGAIYLDKPHEAGTHSDIWKDMEGRTLNESKSRSMMQTIAEEYGNA